MIEVTTYRTWHRVVATALVSLFPFQGLLAAPQSSPQVTRQRAASATLRELQFFGPQKYVRTTGPKDVYVTTISVPTWLASPYRLHIDNGDANGANRVTAGTIDVNGTIIVTDSDFKQNAASFDRTIALTPSTKLTITLASKPASFLTINLFGTSADYTVPTLVWAQPAPSSTINTATPRLLLQYSDATGTNEPAASGVDIDTLKVSIDDIDRTSLFTRRSDEASAQIPATLALAPGAHAYKATIFDLAGNRADITGQFRVDLTAPSITIVQPSNASYLATRTPVIRIGYHDESGLNLDALRVTLNGSDATSLFTRGDAEAIVAWPSGTLLPEGPNQLVVRIEDKGGNPATASVAFNVDVRKPDITIAQPVSGTRIGSRDVPVTITWSDDQAVAFSAASATIDGNAVALTTTATQATAQLTGLSDGLHTLIVNVADRAGNAASATSAFTVDTTVPTIHVTEPAAGAKLKTNTPAVRIDYSDDQGVDVNTLNVTINNIDRTTLFARSNASASATVTGFNLPEGTSTVAAEIRDITANLGKTMSSFLVDTIAPTGTIDSPADRVITNAPTATIHYADSGSGIDPTSVHLFVDSADRSSLITATTDVASGVLSVQPPLADGPHEVKFTFGDQAGNLTTVSKSFVIDTQPPQLTIAVPSNDSFINTGTPALRVTYSDTQGTGINMQSFRLVIQKGNAPETDIASYVTTNAFEADGIVPDASKLTDGTYHLRASIADIAGNLSTSQISFEVDTVAPTYQIESPAPNGYVASTTPQFTIRYDDGLSGVDTTRALVLIDGVNRTLRFTFGDNVGTGTLQPEEALTEGRHTIDVSVFDRAGNKALATQEHFTVDTLAPAAAIEVPQNASYVGKPPYNFAVTYADAAGSGIDPSSVKVAIDGTDRTAEFTVAAARATATITTPLTDGPHSLTVSVLDWAGNPAAATSTFTVDATDPVVKITTPLTDVWLKGPTINVTGTVTDVSPTSVEVNGVVASLSTGAFALGVPATDGSFTVHVVARDVAGNTGQADVRINVDSAAPIITVTAPTPNLITNKSTVHLAGSVGDASSLTLTLNGQPLALASNAFATDVQLNAEGPNIFTLIATDAAGNSSTSNVTIVRDTIAPVITVASPLKSSIIGSVPVAVNGTVVDASAVTATVDGVAATVTGESWQASVGNLIEGPHSFAIVATDAAGNTSTTQHDITVDLNAPIVVIATPVAGSLTKDITSTITGSVTDVSLVSVKASGIDATLIAGTALNEKAFTIAGVPLTEGDNTLHVIATDAIARTTDKTVLVTRDSTPPVVTVAGPDQVTRSRSAHLVATATDNLAIKDVVFRTGTTELARIASGPFVYDFSAPLTAAVGDTLTVIVTATDTAGNIATASKALRFIAEGALTGQVLSDVDGRPVAGARVRMTGSVSSETVTDTHGRYALPVNDQNVVLLIDGTILGTQTATVERVVAVQSGVGTVPVDARLTPLGARASVTSTGTQLHAGNVAVAIPAGAVAGVTGMHLTLLSPQGLTNLLPLGWSPVVAFNVTVEGELAAPLPFDAAISSVAAPLSHLVVYNTTTHAWTMSQAGVSPSAGAVHVSLPAPGSYALVIPDDNSVPVAANGTALTGVDMQPIPDTATSSGDVTPPTLPPTGGSAVGRLFVKTPTPLPSGTIVQAEVTETFSLTSGETASEEKRKEDLVLYRNGADISATFPIVPSRTFTGTDLTEGKVHLDIQAGREAVRGQTGGGNQAVTLNAGTVTLTVPAGSLPNDVALSATPAILSTFLSSSATASPFAEVVLDFSGFTLASVAQISASAASLNVNDTVVIARVVRVSGIPKVVVVASGVRSGDRVVSQELTGFDGIRIGGRYVFYRVSVPWSTVTGTVGLPSGSPAAVIQVDGLPFAALTNDQGQFNAIAPIGVAHVIATVPATSFTGSTSANVVAGQTATVTFGVMPTVTTATVSPATGAIHVPVSVQIEITATAPLNTATANLNTLQLRSSSGQLIPSTYVFSGSGRVVAVVPSNTLDAGASYTLTIGGLADIYGGVVAIAPVTFTTQPVVAPNYDPEKIVFTMPNASGIVSVSAPAASLPPGTRITIINSGNGSVFSFTVGNDGSFTGEILASIDDRLQITVEDPAGNVLTFEKSKYVATDGSGRVAIGPAGGRVDGTNGTALIVPDGALDHGAVFKVEYFGADRFPELPDFPGAHFGGGISITSEQMPTYQKEAKLVFPRPADAPEGSFFYVVRRVTGPNGRVDFETIDHAFPNAEGKIEMASPPYPGIADSAATWEVASFSEAIGFGLAATVNMMMMWSFDSSLPGIALPGVVIGKAYELRYVAGKSDPEYVPISGATIRAHNESGRGFIDDPQSGQPFARSQGDGTFALWDWRYSGGVVTIDATAPDGRKVTVTAFEAHPLDSGTFFTEVFQHYRNAANANVTFPPRDIPVSPEVEVHVMRLTNDLQRVDINGIATANTSLVIGFKFKNGVQGQITSASVNDDEFQVRKDDGTLGKTPLMDYIISNPYSPTAAGRYSVKAKYIDPTSPGPSLDTEFTFLVVAEGGSNGVSLPGVAPDWITAKLVPKPNEIGVPLGVLPQVVFTEPVVNVLAGLTLTKSSNGGITDAQFTVSGVGLDAHGFPIAIANLHDAPPTIAVTSITILPTGGLDFGAVYTLHLTSAIKDTDTDALGNPAPHPMPDRILKFTTIAPASVGDSPSKFESGAVVVLGGYAFVAQKEPQGINGWMTAYDLTDLATPTEVGRINVSGQPLDISGEEESVANDGFPAVVVGSGLKIVVPGPSNVYMFDVRNPAKPQRIAAVSVTESAEDGTVLKTVMRKNFVYTITYPHGIQVIDLNIAKSLFAHATEDASSRFQMNLALVTQGVGFGQEAVVQTIPLHASNGSLVHVFDLQAGEYQVNGQLKTLIYATGISPLVIVDPSDPNNPHVTGPAPTSNGTLDSGRGIALARISNRDLAIVIGNGMARTDGTGSLVAGGTGLMVFDLTDPFVPNLIGSYSLKDSPTDLAVSGSTVLVATGSGTMGFSLVDPTKPRYLGTIAGTASRIAIGTGGGILVSVGPKGAVAASGLHTASLFPVLIIKQVDAIKAMVEGAGTVDSPEKLRTLEGTDVKVQLIPPVTPTNATVRITNARFPHSDGSSGGVGTDTFNIEWTDPENGEGVIHLGANNLYEDTELVAIATATTSIGTLTSQPRKIQLGWVKLIVDSNNNTALDDRDIEAKRKGRAFAFWESDPIYELVKTKVGLGATDAALRKDDPLKGLSDWATIRVVVNKTWWEKLEEKDQKVRLRVNFNGKPAVWYLAEKVGVGLDYLNSTDTAGLQRDKIKGSLSGDQLVPICSPSGEKLIVPESQCSHDGNGSILLPNLSPGTHEYLFRCEYCNRDSLRNPDSVAEMDLEFGPTSVGPWTQFDRAKVDVRPVNQWMTVMSARPPGNMAFTPLPTLIEPEPIPESASPFANSAWPSAVAIPPRAKNVTIVVHGYNVTPEDAQVKFLPTYLKRLYWAGLPILRRQGNWWKQDESPGCVNECAHAVGISWPSDDSGPSDVEQFLDMAESFRAVYASTRFPFDEFHALGTGPALAKYLSAVRSQYPARSINVVAHSLGNMAVNSALYRLNTPGIVDKFVMNEAAMPAESLGLGYAPTEEELTLYGDHHAAAYGYPDDDFWTKEYAGASQLTGTPVQWQQKLDIMRAQGLSPDISAQEMYTRRWLQIRPFPLPDNDLTNKSRRGPWNAYFGRNHSQTRIFNTYSENDMIMGVVWRGSQRLLKPYTQEGVAALAEKYVRDAVNKAIRELLMAELGIPEPESFLAVKVKEKIEELLPKIEETHAQDNLQMLTWELTGWTKPEQATVFGGADTQHFSTLRQWAELSFWFPSTSFGAGVRNLDSVLGARCLVDSCNTNFTRYSMMGETAVKTPSVGAFGDSVLYGTLFAYTHGYLAYGKFTDVYKAYREIAKILDTKN